MQERLDATFTSIHDQPSGAISRLEPQLSALKSASIQACIRTTGSETETLPTSRVTFYILPTLQQIAKRILISF
jgi:hypothetical protein